MVTELLRRIYLPLYLPVISILVCFLTLTSKDKFSYKKTKSMIFIFSTLVLIISEISLRFSGVSLKENLIFISMPVILFLFSILLYKKKLNYN